MAEYDKECNWVCAPRYVGCDLGEGIILNNWFNTVTFMSVSIIQQNGVYLVIESKNDTIIRTKRFNDLTAATEYAKLIL